MDILQVKYRLQSKSIFLSEDSIVGRPTVIGYEKQFRWRWFATQLNTFIVAVDFGDETITVDSIEDVLAESFEYARKNYRGWPRGFQSALASIAIVISSNIEDDAATYCRKLEAGKKWAGFSVPVAVDTRSGKIHSFEKKPMWGSIYYPYFKQTIGDLTC